MNAKDGSASFPSSAPDLRSPETIRKLLAIGAILTTLVLLFAYAAGWLTPSVVTPAAVINRFEQLSGPQPGFRRNHAKGVCISGYFESNGKGAELSKALVFAPGRTPVIGRFALAGGQPYQADAEHTVRSMALLFQLADGEEWRAGMNNIPVFPVATGQAFYELLKASAPDPATGKPNPESMKEFLAQHPEAGKALGLLKAAAASSGFDNSTYNSLNAFRFINAKGESIPVRWSMVAVRPFEPFNAAAHDAADKNFLFDDLIKSVNAAPLQWRLVVTLGQPGDSTSDPTIPWPADRPTVDVGTLTVDHIESEDTSPARDINFDPLILPDGIAGSDDQILSARSSAYSRSFTRREGEAKQPSAISPSATKK